MKRQRVNYSARAFRRNSYLPRQKLYPVTAFRIDYQDLTIQIKERIEAGIALTVDLLHVITF